jgi:hypothetical protein
VTDVCGVQVNGDATADDVPDLMLGAVDTPDPSAEPRDA